MGSVLKRKLALVFLAGIAVRLLFFSGYVQTDDAHYALSAWRWAEEGRLAHADQFGTRLGLLAPTALAFRWFGVSAWTAAGFAFLCSIAAVPLVGRLAAGLWGERTGVLAALLYAFLPLDVLFASRMFPCSPIGLATVGALILLLLGEGRRAVFGAGVCLGLAATFRLTAFFALGPILLSALVWNFPRRRHLVWGAAGVAAVMAIEAATFAWLTGDPTFRFQALLGPLAEQGDLEGLTSAGTAWFLAAPWLRLFSEQEMGFYPYLAVPALVYWFRKAETARERFLLLWVAFLYLYTVYGTTAPWRYAPLPRLPRYLSIVAPAAIVLTAAWLARAFRPRAQAVIVGALAATSIGFCALDNGRAVSGPARELAGLLAADPGTMTLDARFAQPVFFFWGFQPPGVTTVVELDPPLSRRSAGGGLAPVVSAWSAAPSAKYVAMRSDGGGSPPPGMERIASIRAPDTLYYRLLRHPLFLRLLGLVRNDYRVDGLRRLSGEGIDVYRRRVEPGP